MVRHLQKLWQNKKILKRRKEENQNKKHTVTGYPITTPHSWNPLSGMDGDQLQPGVEDGETPTEVVTERENPKKKKTRKSQIKGGP
jgi:hypothetical protein